MPIWGYPPMLAAFVIDSTIFQTAMIVLASASGCSGWSGTLFLSSTRMIFAAAFDRMLPECAGSRVRRPGRAVGGAHADHGPVDRAQLALRLHSDFYGLTLDATLVIAVTFFGTAIAATILPW